MYDFYLYVKKQIWLLFYDETHLKKFPSQKKLDTKNKVESDELRGRLILQPVLNLFQYLAI